MAGVLVTGQGPPNAVMQIQPGMQVEVVTLVDSSGNPLSSLAPSGTAGGVLSGTYPNPGFAAAPTFTGTTTVATLAATTVNSTTVDTTTLAIKNAANQKMGTGTLNGSGTVTVANTSVTASSVIFLTSTGTAAATIGALAVSAKSAGVNFTVISSLTTDASTFNYLIVEPG